MAVQEPLSPRLATGQSPASLRSVLSSSFLFSLLFLVLHLYLMCMTNNITIDDTVSTVICLGRGALLAKFACKVVRAGRTFSSTMIDLLMVAMKPHHQIRLNRSF